MKILRAFVAPALAASLAASVASIATAATSIPADLSQRAADLRRPASAEVLSWVHEQGVTLAKAHGAIPVGALQRTVRGRFAVKSTPKNGSPGQILGDLSGADIEAMCFIVMMEAAKSAEEDLEAIMAGVKAINQQKEQIREAEQKLQQQAATHTPTPGPNRVTQLVTAAKALVSKTEGANIANVVPR